MPQAFHPVPDGRAGIEEILATLTRLKDFYGRQYGVRLAAAAVAGGQINDDQGGHVARLADFVRKAIVYTKDPVNAELIQTPDLLLLELNRTGRARGDCDDHVLLFASLAESLGIPVDVAGVSLGGVQIDHVIAVAYPHGRVVEIDLCWKGGGPQPAYPHKVFSA